MKKIIQKACIAIANLYVRVAVSLYQAASIDFLGEFQCTERDINETVIVSAKHSHLYKISKFPSYKHVEIYTLKREDPKWK